MPAHKLEELRGSKTFMLHLNNMAQLMWPMCGGNNLREGGKFRLAKACRFGALPQNRSRACNVAVIDPNQDYKLIKWIPTSRRPRDMKFATTETTM
jgi:hypothetical protein